MSLIESVTSLRSALAEAGYYASEDLAQMVDLAARLHRPLLLEGPAGVGKTSLAQALARVHQRELIRLQCFEGMDSTQALYDWNVHKQFLAITQGTDGDVFTEPFLMPRPLLKALQSSDGAVLLIDEIDRADEALEALLLEVLGEWQITVPEWETVSAKVQPITLLTSNRTRPLSDALRRRCLYVHLSFPSEAQEVTIVQRRIPSMDVSDARRLVTAVQLMRTWPLVKAPGVAETLDWCQAWSITDGVWDKGWVRATLGCVVKDEADLAWVTQRLDDLINGFT